MIPIADKPRKLTHRQIEILTVAKERSVVSSERLPLRVISNLVNKRLLEYCDMELGDRDRIIYSAWLTTEGEKALQEGS